MIEFPLKLWLNHRFHAVCHNFHWFQQPIFIPFMLRRRSREQEWEIWEARSRNFWKFGVGYFNSDGATLLDK